MLKNLITDPLNKKIFKALGNNARFVGGCVRNALLENAPQTDIDIATPLLPEETIKLLESAGIKAIPTGIKHGTITAVADGQNIEITTLRRDIACDGRHAEVEFTDDWEQDAARRDFTINAMSADIKGNIYDYFGGQEDLKNNVVRFVGNAENRCAEDVLRILRFFRFNSYYGKAPIDDEGLVACIKYEQKISDLSGERIQNEMLKLFAAPDPSYVLGVMYEVGILNIILLTHIDLDALDRLIKIEQKLAIKINPLLRLATLISAGIVDKDDLYEVLAKWKLSNNSLKFLESVILPRVEFFSDMKQVEVHKFIRANGNENALHILLIYWAQDTQSDDNFYIQLYNYIDKWRIPVFPVSGNDLKKIGISEGRQMGKALQRAEEWWEASGYSALKDDILTYIQQTNFSL
jgi:poly(A) polymerase